MKKKKNFPELFLPVGGTAIVCSLNYNDMVYKPSKASLIMPTLVLLVTAATVPSGESMLHTMV